MQISFTKHPNVTVMHIIGDVDSTNYTDVVIKAQEAYTDGARNLLLDLAKVNYVSSAGLMSFHTLARIFSGHSIESNDKSRPTFRAINIKEDLSVRDHFKLLSPQPAVEQVLDVVGLKQFLEIHTDLDDGINSFS